MCPDIGLNLRYVCHQGRAFRVPRYYTGPAILPVLVPRLCHPVDLLGVLVKTVVTQLEIDIFQDYQTHGHPDGQPRDIDKGVTLPFAQVPQGESEIAFEHRMVRCVWISSF